MVSLKVKDSYSKNNDMDNAFTDLKNKIKSLGVNNY